MAMLTVRNLPDDVHQALKMQAAQHGRSTEAEVREILAMTVFEEDAPQFAVKVVYGTSQRTTELVRGEFVICKAKNAAAYREAGLNYDTKFDLKQSIELPYSTQWFSVPPGSLTQEPKLGLLHPSMMRALEAAYRAASSWHE